MFDTTAVGSENSALKYYSNKMEKIIIFLLLLSLCCATGPDHDSACSKPLSGGHCLAYMERFGFDTRLGKCVMFVYGGCRGNENNFDTMEACQKQCEQDWRHHYNFKNTATI